MSDHNGRFLLKDKDFVDVVDESGEVVEGLRVPKHWDNDQLAPGFKKKASSAPAKKAAAPDGGKAKPEGEPAGNASTEDWVEYARTKKDAEDADLLDEAGEPLSRDELREKFGTPTPA